MLSDAFTLKKLEIFLAFMRSGTLSDAAEKLNMSSVSVHRAIHSLEEELKCPLFRQEGRLLVPLPTAKVLEEQAEQVIHSLEEAINTTRETAGLYSNLFKLGALYSLTLTTVPKLIAGLKLRNGDLNIELMLNSNDALLKKLRGFELDAMLIALDDSFDTPEFTTLPLFEDDILLAVPRDSELAKQEAITLAKLINPTFVTLTNGFATFRDSYRVFDQAGFEPNVVMQVSDIFSLISMVGAGVGYALLPKRVEKGFEDKIKLIPIEGQDTVRQKIGMVCLASRERDPRILSCIAECRAYHREHHQAD
jgi:LysR family malonate utilization transcriptional regulator